MTDRAPWRLHRSAAFAATLIFSAAFHLPAAAITVANVATTDIAARTAIAIDPQGRSHVLFERTEPPTPTGVRTLFHAVRRGATWSLEPIGPVTDFDSPPGLAVVDSAEVHVAYISNSSGTPELLYAHRTASGWSAPVSVPVGSTMSPTACDLAVTSTGSPRIALALWNGSSHPDTSASELRLLELGPTGWSSEVVDTARRISTCAIALGPAGVVGIAYGSHHSSGFGHPGDWDLVFAERFDTPPVTAWSFEFPVSNNYDQAHAVKVAYLVDGTPVMAAAEFHGAFRYNYAIIYSRIGLGSSWSSVTLDNYDDGHSTLQVALAVDSQNRLRAATSFGDPSVRWGVSYDGFVRYPHEFYPEFGIHVETTNPTGPALDYVSLAFDRSDNPQLVYLKGNFPTPVPQDGASTATASYAVMFADSASGNSGVGVDSSPKVGPLALRAWPTPFRSGVRLSLLLPRDVRDLRVEALDVEGRVVARLWRGEAKAGELNLKWDGSAGGRPLRNGVFWVRARAEGLHADTKVVRVE